MYVDAEFVNIISSPSFEDARVETNEVPEETRWVEQWIGVRGRRRRGRS